MELFGIASVASISVIAELGAIIWRQLPLDNKWIPTVCLVLGGILGGVGSALWPSVYPASDMLTAIAIGIASGGAAVGAYEAVTTVQEAAALEKEATKAE